MRFLFLIGLALLSGQAFSKLTQTTLDNGLQVIVKEDHRAPVAMAMIWYHVGAADEPGGLTGISHAIEHMMFKGTPLYPGDSYNKTISALGGQNNAVTNSDYTAYFALISAVNLPIFLQLEADRMQHAQFEKADFDKEIKVIQEERRMRTDDKPQSVLIERFLAAAHLSEGYHHPAIGWMSDLEQLDVDSLKAWFTDNYAPNNATLVIVGDVDTSHAIALANRYFKAIPRRKLPTRKPEQEPPSNGPKRIEVNIPAQIPMLILGYTVPSIKTAPAGETQDPYTLEVIAGLLSAGDSARLPQQLVNQSHIASAVEVYYNLNARLQTQFMLFGVPSATSSLIKLKTGLLNEIKHLQTDLVDSRELQRVKKQIIAQKLFDRDSVYDQAMELGQTVVTGVNINTLAHYEEHINQVTPEQIKRVAQRYLVPNGLTEARLNPKSIK